MEKKSLQACERDEARRAAWLKELRDLAEEAPRGVASIRFVDESACALSLTRAYGWAKRGRRCIGKVPGNPGKRHTLVGLLSLGELGKGITAYDTQEGSLKGADFERFVERHIVPQLVAGDVVVLDNATCHKGPRVRQRIEAAGARLVFLPPYSPDFSPIELAWRKVKAALRRAAARSKEELLTAIAEAVRRVTAEDAASFYRHCGYTGYPTAAPPRQEPGEQPLPN